MARDLPPRAATYAESEIRNAIKEARLALEILGSRYSDPDSAKLFGRLSWRLKALL